MKKPNITLGEWHLGKRAGAEYGAIYGEKGEEIALPLSFFSTEEEARANARLIAAAPAMAEALERILYAHEAPSGASNGEAKLCPMFASMAKEALTLAGYEF